jgi:hypothetical protein
MKVSFTPLCPLCSMAGNKGGKETDMISNKQLDRWLKEQKLSLVLCDVTFPGELPAFHPELAGLGKGHYADGGVWSCVYWEERLVVAHFEILGGTHPKMLGPDPFLIHELVHAAMPLPPNLCVEARSWMFGAEMKIAGAWARRRWVGGEVGRGGQEALVPRA